MLTHTEYIQGHPLIKRVLKKLVLNWIKIAQKGPKIRIPFSQLSALMTCLSEMLLNILSKLVNVLSNFTIKLS